MPFMGPPRVIILRGVDRYNADDLNILSGYLEDPNTDTCLVMVAEKPDMRMKFFKRIKEKKLEVSFQVPKGRGLTVWVKESMSRRGAKMTDEAARLLVERIGQDLMELDGELEKIYLYALDRKTIGPDDVRFVSRLGQTANIFELGDAVGEQKPGKAVAALQELLVNSHHLPVLVMLIRHFRLLLKAKILQTGQNKDIEPAKALGLPPFAARKYMEQARKLGLNDIKKGLARLMETNLALMSSTAPAHILMDRLVLDLATIRSFERRPAI